MPKIQELTDASPSPSRLESQNEQQPERQGIDWGWWLKFVAVTGFVALAIAVPIAGAFASRRGRANGNAIEPYNANNDNDGSTSVMARSLFSPDCSTVVQQNELFIDFSDEHDEDLRDKLHEHFMGLHKQWGRDSLGNSANNGVVVDNIELRYGKGLVLKANGEEYSQSKPKGVDRKGNPVSSNKKVGAVAISRNYFSFGEYEMVATIPPDVASSLWTFNYREFYDGMPGHEECDAKYGSVSDGAGGSYCTENHEIDIELFAKPRGGLTASTPSTSIENAAFNTFVSETTLTDEFMKALPDESDMADGEFHRFKFDWKPDSVEFYVDGVLRTVITTDIPSVPGRVNMGPWFAEWGGEGTFDQNEMVIESFRFTPNQFTETSISEDELDFMTCEFMQELGSSGNPALVLSLIGAALLACCGSVAYLDVQQSKRWEAEQRERDLEAQKKKAEAENKAEKGNETTTATEGGDAQPQAQAQAQASSSTAAQTQEQRDQASRQAVRAREARQQQGGRNAEDGVLDCVADCLCCCVCSAFGL